MPLLLPDFRVKRETMSQKTIVCRCEDVTLWDLQQCFAEGYLDIEEVKRFTGLGTGPCQGKECQLHTCRLLQVERLKHPERTAQQPEAPQTDHPFTTRPPVYSVPLGVLARSGSASPHAPQAPAASKRKP